MLGNDTTAGRTTRRRGLGPRRAHRGVRVCRAGTRETRPLDSPTLLEEGCPRVEGNGLVQGPAGQGTESGIAFSNEALRCYDPRRLVSINACARRELTASVRCKTQSPGTRRSESQRRLAPVARSPGIATRHGLRDLERGGVGDPDASTSEPHSKERGKGDCPNGWAGGVFFLAFQSAAVAFCRRVIGRFDRRPFALFVGRCRGPRRPPLRSGKVALALQADWIRIAVSKPFSLCPVSPQTDNRIVRGESEPAFTPFRQRRACHPCRRGPPGHVSCSAGPRSWVGAGPALHPR